MSNQPNTNLLKSQNLADALARWAAKAMFFRVASHEVIVPTDLPVLVTGTFGNYPYTIRYDPAARTLTLTGNYAVRESVVAQELTARYGQPEKKGDCLTWQNVLPAHIPTLDFSKTPLG